MKINDIQPRQRSAHRPALQHIARFHKAMIIPTPDLEPLKHLPVPLRGVQPTVFGNTPTAKTAKPAKRHIVFDFIQYPLIASIAIGGAYSSAIGQWLVLAYFIVASIWRISSRTTFTIALLLLISIPLFQILKETGISQNAAIYTYEMLVVGTVQAGWELWRDGRRTRRV